MINNTNAPRTVSWFVTCALLAGMHLLVVSTARAGLIEARIDEQAWQDTNYAELLWNSDLQLRVKEMEGAQIRWYQIVPNISKRYNNAVWPWLPNAYQWKGFDQIEYETIHLSQYDGQWQVAPFGHRTTPENHLAITPVTSSLWNYLKRRIWPVDLQTKGYGQPLLGSFWYGVEIEKDGRLLATTGLEHSDKRGLSPKVFRVSVKKSSDLLGNLTGYFNVPAVFGSTPYQVKNYIGVDCADVLMAAYCHTNNIAVEKDYNVAMLTGKFPKVARTKIEQGDPDKKIEWGKDIKPGDFIAVRHSPNSQFIHIGALYADGDNDGLLSPGDIVLHAGPDPLHFSSLDSGAFDGIVVVLRPTPHDQ